MKRSDFKFRSKLHQSSDFVFKSTKVASRTGFETMSVLIQRGSESTPVSKEINGKLEWNETKPSNTTNLPYLRQHSLVDRNVKINHFKIMISQIFEIQTFLIDFTSSEFETSKFEYALVVTDTKLIVQIVSRCVFLFIV